ncbi:MAG: hypothetical protein HKN54_08660 [Flavobacteriaceae bacterium]|nr:hypothetical protein [Flavobacteriaceae bacterium]
MKRIDDKIKEIEKKDKQSRWAYYVIAAILLGFLWYASTTRETIGELNKEIEEQLKQVRKDSATIQDQLTALKKSMDPDDYWNHVKLQGSNEAYINYITNKFKIDKSEYLPIAINNLTSTELQGFEGWIFTGLVKNDKSYENRDVVEVIFRDGKEVTNDAIRTSRPVKGDIIRLLGKQNKNTYQYHNESGPNELGFRNKTKAFVSNTWEDPNSARYEIYIKYY